ncbi:hypothetical protein BV25DRAFT_1905334 [Artomyces pyxidatus]|uniref:Uncharacterized protein n=1 Tax=Artomyces pyxidatus TaxID=48021 RepID=A0ACB8TEF5_9AGAM|nr:hypothetical protein BV25DRAFT_1905334 [Artomyces pyxidatus]
MLFEDVEGASDLEHDDSANEEEDEARNDFFGLLSNPLSIYHTGPARPVCIHAISSIWHELGEKIYKLFDSIELKWTSIDPVGVLPGTLSPHQAKGPAARCKENLPEHGITDVEIAFRESIFTRHAGPQLLDHVSSVDPTVDVRGPFTPACPYFEGTGCLYLRESSESDRVFLLTARHVLYHRKNNNMPRREVIHLGSRAFQNALEAIMDKIGNWDFMVDGYEEELAGLGEHVEGEDLKTTSERQKISDKLEEARASKASVFEFHRNITSLWSAESQRILGHVVYAPPISVGTGKCTVDWALDAFRGNVIHLGFKLTRNQFMKKMYPHSETRANFKYPPGGLMQLRNIVTYDDLRRPTMLDANGEECIIVVKNGAATGVTLGRATGIEETAVYPYSHKDGAFSAPGDSGSVVGDANYGVVGMLIGGAGHADFTDVTYEGIKQALPNPYLFPIRDPTQA